MASAKQSKSLRWERADAFLPPGCISANGCLQKSQIGSPQQERRILFSVLYCLSPLCPINRVDKGFIFSNSSRYNHLEWLATQQKEYLSNVPLLHLVYIRNPQGLSPVAATSTTLILGKGCPFIAGAHPVEGGENPQSFTLRGPLPLLLLSLMGRGGLLFPCWLSPGVSQGQLKDLCPAGFPPPSPQARKHELSSKPFLSVPAGSCMFQAALEPETGSLGGKKSSNPGSSLLGCPPRTGFPTQPPALIPLPESSGSCFTHSIQDF